MRYSRVLWCLLLVLPASCRKPLPINGARCTAGEPNCVCDTQSGECFIQGVNSNTTNGCTALTCDGISATCGEFIDKCTKKTINCGTCDTGQVCQYQRDSSNQPTSSTCIVGTATTCASLNYNCGTYTDPTTNQVHDCTAEVNAGQPCAVGTSCGGGGQANICGCTPLTCSDLGRVCGDHDGDGQPLKDGCGGFLNCDVQAGGCGAGKVCNFTAGACESSTCTPFSCTQLGNPCGKVSDGCGGLITCSAGVCAQDQWCDPTSHTCLWTDKSCVGTTCSPSTTALSQACTGRDCGQATDACGNSSNLTCGSACGGGLSCIANKCETPPNDSNDACPPGRCGPNVFDPTGTVTLAKCNPTPGPGQTRQQAWNALCPGGQLCEPNTGYCMDPGPTTCVAQGKNCGNIYWVDSSGSHQVACGTCSAEPGYPQFLQTCGGSNVEGVCALPLASAVCVANNVLCGDTTDSCGDSYLCGLCQKGNKCQAEAGPPAISQCEACAASDYYTCATTYANMCGSNLDDHCYGTIGCGCPDDNSNGLFGPAYKRNPTNPNLPSCGAPSGTAAAACTCTPDPNVCKNANACETTLPDDGCGHQVSCGTCASISMNPPDVCEQDNKTCCVPDTSICATSCSATAKSECGGQIDISCTGCTTSESNDSGTVCGGECTGNSFGAAACQPSGACCNPGSYVATCTGGPNGTCQESAAAGTTCCTPWTCNQFLAANPSAANSTFAKGTIADGCGGKIQSVCSFCDTGDNYGTGGATTSDGALGGKCCQCQPYAAGDCATQVNKNEACNQTITRTCTPSAGDQAVEPSQCWTASTPPAPNTASAFTCTVANECAANSCNVNFCNDGSGDIIACTCPVGDLCGSNDICCTAGQVLNGGVCCTQKTCAQQGYGKTQGASCTGNPSDGCGGTLSGCDVCNAGLTCESDGICCSAAAWNGSACCPAGQQWTTVNNGTATAICCPAGEVNNDGVCCTPKTCAQVDNGTVGASCGASVPDQCGGDILSTCGCNTGETCTSGSCTCTSPPHTCVAGDCGTFNAGQCNQNTCPACPGTEVCNVNTCGACTLPVCGNACNKSVSNSCGTVPCSCTGVACNTTTDQCCTAGQVVVGGVCCNGSQVSGNTCCPSGEGAPENEAAPGDGACCANTGGDPTTYWDGSHCCNSESWSGALSGVSSGQCTCTAYAKPATCNGSNGPACSASQLTGCCCSSGGEYLSNSCGQISACNSGSSGGG